MGFLDMFDNPNIMQSLLGIGDNMQEGQTAPPPPTPSRTLSGGIGSDRMGSDMTAGGPPQMANDPAQTPDFGIAGVPLPRPAPPAAMNATNTPGQPIVDASVPLPTPAPGQAPPLPQAQTFNVARPPGMEPPIPGPGMQTADGNGNGVLPAGAKVAGPAPAPGGLPPPTPGGAQPPANGAFPGAQPVQLPPINVGASPATSGQGGGLAAAFGLSPDRIQANQTGDRVRAAMSGIGKGLSAIGSLPAGAPKGQAFAAGLGGSLQGVAAAQEKDKTDQFNQSSTAFKDMLAAMNSDDTAGYRAAQSKYLNARAQSLMTGGNGKGSSAWQNTDYGKVIQVENEAQKYEKGQQILLGKRWTANGSTAEQQKEDLDQLAKNVESYRNRLYKQTGIDPNKAEKLKNMGTSQDNPFDTKGMSIEQFHDQVPMGAWFKDQNGVSRQRTVPPPSAGAQPAAAAPGAAANNDDYSAMQPAA